MEYYRRKKKKLLLRLSSIFRLTNPSLYMGMCFKNIFLPCLVIQLKVILLLACFSFVPVKHNQAKQKWLSKHWDTSLLKNIQLKWKVWNNLQYISSHCWDSCHNYILKQTRNHLTQCFSIFFLPQHTWGIQYNVSNSGSPIPGVLKWGAMDWHLCLSH